MSGDREVVRPESVEELSEVVARAHRERLSLMPRGSGHWPVPFALDAADLVVDLTRLDRIVEHSPEDLVASIECGLGFDACARRLADKGQRIPLDPPGSPAGTIGGLLARDAYGPSKLRHGTARDWLIGATLVRFDGRIVESGGMVVKNVSGYDLGKLYVGAWGSLGILVRANFKLAPVPEAEVGLFVEAERGAAGRIVEATRRHHLPLASAVWLGERLVVVLEGLEGAIEKQGREVERIAGEQGGRTTAVAGEHARRVTREARGADTSALLLRLGYPPADFEAVGAAIEDALIRSRADRPDEASLPGCGVSWLAWERPPCHWPVLVDELRRVCGERAGWLMVERRPEDVPEGFSPWAIAPAALAVMRRLKTALDPRSVFPDVLP